jgi:hypothetical protein
LESLDGDNKRKKRGLVSLSPQMLVAGVRLTSYLNRFHSFIRPQILYSIEKNELGG